MTETATPLPDRLEELPALTLDRSSHTSFEEGHCAMELVAYLAGEEHTDRPACTSPVLTRFLINLNDALPDDARQKLKPYLPKVIGTRDDQDEARGWLATDWAIRTALPTWLELNGTSEAATMLRALDPITADNFADVRPKVFEIRREAWARRDEAMGELRKRVREEVKKALKAKKLPVAAAVAVAVAEAAAEAVAAAVAVAAAEAAAEAVAEAVAVAVAEAVAVAVAEAEAVAVAVAAAVAAAEAAAVAVAVAAAVAVAVAAAVAAAEAEAVAVAEARGDLKVGSDSYWEFRTKVREATKKAIQPVLDEKIRPTSASLLDSALETLEKMIDPKAAA